MEDNKQPNPALEMGYIESYINLANKRLIILSEDITKDTATQLSALLLYYNTQSKKDPIILCLHSNGGDATALINIYDVMQMIKAPVYTICMGKCYSAAAIILAAGAKGHRIAMKNSKIMIHGLQCNFPLQGDDVLNSKNYYQFLQNSDDSIMKLLVKHTGKTLKEIKEDCSRDFYLSPKKAKQYGLIDHIF